jgi:hypothetical protein
MLTRPEIGTVEHICLWLSNKPIDETYVWMSDLCPWAQYAIEHLGVVPNIMMGGQAPPTPELQQLNRVSKDVHTFGALYERMSR